MSDFMNQNSEDSEAESSDNTQQNEQPDRSGSKPDFGKMPEMPDFGGKMPSSDGGKMPGFGGRPPQGFDPGNMPQGLNPNNAPKRPDKGQGGRPQPGGSFPGMTGSETTDHTTEFILLGVSALVLLLGLGFALKFKR